MKELDKSDFGVLQQKHPTDYYIDNDKNHILRIYVFASENEYYQRTALIEQKINAKQPDIKEEIWSKLTSKYKERINGTWKDAKLRIRTLNKDMGIINDKTYINKEIYIVDFPTKDISIPNNMLVFASLEDYKIIGYGYVE